MITPFHPEGVLGNVESEQGVLGAILFDNKRYAIVDDIICADDFTWHPHWLIYDALTRLVKLKQTANPVTMQHLFNDKADWFPERNPGKYMVRLAFFSGCWLSDLVLRLYALDIADLSLRRAMAERLLEGRSGESVPDILASYERRTTFLREQLEILWP